MGGGIGINYENQLDAQIESRVYIDKILPELLNQLKELGLKILIELGRSIIGSAGLLITKIVHIMYMTTITNNNASQAIPEDDFPLVATGLLAAGAGVFAAAPVLSVFEPVTGGLLFFDS